MQLICKVIQDGVEIGEFTQLSQDMWYMEGQWTPFQTEQTIAFEKTLQHFTSALFMKNPEKAPRVALQPVAASDNLVYCLVCGLDGNSLLLRQVITPEGLDQFFPNRKK